MIITMMMMKIMMMIMIMTMMIMIGSTDLNHNSFGPTVTNPWIVE